MSKYGYLEVFLRVPSISRVDYIFLGSIDENEILIL